MRRCKFCGEEVIEQTFSVGDGMDGVSVCTGCEEIEGDTYEDEEE